MKQSNNKTILSNKVQIFFPFVFPPVSFVLHFLSFSLKKCRQWCRTVPSILFFDSCFLPYSWYYLLAQQSPKKSHPSLPVKKNSVVPDELVHKLFVPVFPWILMLFLTLACIAYPACRIQASLLFFEIVENSIV